jgi:phosphoribosylaminoimidazole-succinocarboxamide synthase
MADTKLEFGQDGKTLVLVNEISTPDCSRFWPIDRYQPGKVQESWDKEFLENHLRKKGLSPASSSVPIPERLRREMSEIYRRVAALV